MKPCDEVKIELYLNGALAESEMAAFEAHASECSACATELDRVLAPSRRLVKRSIQLEAVPEVVRARVFARDTRRIVRLWWAVPATAALLAVAWFVVGSQDDPIIASVTGLVYVDGEVAQAGAKIRNGNRVTTTGPAVVVLDGRTFRSGSGWNEFVFELNGHSWTVKDQVAPLEIAHKGKSKGFAIRLGDWFYTPLGTRFSLEPAFEERPMLDVFESAVTVWSHNLKQIVKEGQSLSSEGLKAVQDDPATAVGKQLPKIRLFNRVRTLTLDGPGEALPDDAKAIIAAASRLSTTDPRRYVDISLELTRIEDRRAAGFVIARLLALDPSASSATQAELRDLLYGQAAFEGDSDIAVRLATLLATRRRDFPATDWHALLTSPELVESVGAAKRLVLNLAPTGQIAVWATIVGAANESRDRLSSPSQRTVARRFAMAWLGRLLRDSGQALTTRTLARAYGVLAEAQYFTVGMEQDSLQTLATSVSLWPRAHMRIHLVARRAEAGFVSTQDRDLIASAFAEAPTFKSAERVLTFLRDTSSGLEGVRELETFADWIGETYQSVPEAQALAAEHVYLTNPMRAYELMKREIELWHGGVRAKTLNHAVFYAKLLWALRGRIPEAPATATVEEIARTCGLMKGDQLSPSAYEFVALTGDNERALRLLSVLKLSVQDRLLAEAKLLRSLGRVKEAIQDIRLFLASASQVSDSFQVHEAQVSLAELEAIGSPETGQKLARGYLHSQGVPLDVGWRRFRHYDLKFKARAYWVLGERKMAIRLQKEYLGATGWNANRAEDEQMLRKWESKQ